MSTRTAARPIAATEASNEHDGGGMKLNLGMAAVGAALGVAAGLAVGIRMGLRANRIERKLFEFRQAWAIVRH